MRAYKNAFADWKSPGAMRLVVEELRYSHGLKLMYQPQLKFWHEAFIAAKFGALLKLPWVRLICDTDRPDFEIVRDDEVSRFEITEADRVNRRRGAEYKNLQRKFERGEDVTAVTWSEWLTPSIVAFDLKRVSDRKAHKHYDSDVGLIISLQGVEFDSMERENDEVMHRATELAGLTFDSVWVLLNSRLRQLWCKREQTALVYRPS